MFFLFWKCWGRGGVVSELRFCYNFFFALYGVFVLFFPSFLWPISGHFVSPYTGLVYGLRQYLRTFGRRKETESDCTLHLQT